MADAELSDYQAAAYRVLTACEYSIEEAYRVDGQSITVPQALLDDARMVIERWNADHPADDDEPITQEWKTLSELPDNVEANDISKEGGDDQPEWWLYLRCDYCGEAQPIREVETRGDVRAFLRGMGRKTNESVATGTLRLCELRLTDVDRLG